MMLFDFVNQQKKKASVKTRLSDISTDASGHSSYVYFLLYTDVWRSDRVQELPYEHRYGWKQLGWIAAFQTFCDLSRLLAIAQKHADDLIIFVCRMAVDHSYCASTK
jgi:hypothetical protein